MGQLPIMVAQPVKAEMSVAQLKERIDLDVMLVCRKRGPAAVSQ